MKVLTTLPQLLCVICVFTACHTVPKAGTETTKIPTSIPAKRSQLAKEGQKAFVHGQDPTTSPLIQGQAENFELLYQRLADTTLPPQDEDLAAGLKLHNSSRGSLEEAIFILAQMRNLQLALVEKSGFQAKDLYEEKESQNLPRDEANPLSLEQLTVQLNINLVEVLKINSHLQNSQVSSLIRDLLDRSQNSSDFYQSIKSLVLSPTLGMTAPHSPSTDTSAQRATDTPPKPKSEVTQDSALSSPDYIESSEVKAAMSDLKKSDIALMQAQRAADKGEFRLAIDQAEQIDRSDPFYDLAKEKIKSFSNMAVQDLRKKAAEAFQNSMPIHEPKAKLAYLVQARDLLEKALKDYPAADQLDRVRENLEVIKRDLANLEGQGSSPSTL